MTFLLCPTCRRAWTSAAPAPCCGVQPVGYWVGEVCKAANVRKVPPHGLRGTHTTIATSAGVTAHVVAAALGHAGPDVTREHYIQPGAEDAATAKKLTRRMETN